MDDTRGASRFPGVFIVSVAVLAIASWFLWCRLLPVPHTLRVAFLDVGQGDGIVIETPSGKRLVVDAGPRSDLSSAGLRTVVPYLRATGAQRVDALLLTHADSDHIGGAADVLKAMEVRNLIISRQESESPAMSEVLRTARAKGVQIVDVAAGQSLDFRDGVTGRVIYPPAGHIKFKGDKNNDVSIVLRLQYRVTSFLLTGDAEEAAEQRVLHSHQPVAADILKVGHHGSHTSSSPAFLRAVHPLAAIISCGRHNAFGHPHPEVTSRLSQLRIPCFRTDTDGAVIVESDGRTIRVRKTVHKAR